MGVKLPSKLGAELVLLADNPEVLNWLHWHGFGVFGADHSALRLRRWSRPGIMLKEPEPRCPAGAERLIIAAKPSPRPGSRV